MGRKSNKKKKKKSQKYEALQRQQESVTLQQDGALHGFNTFRSTAIVIYVIICVFSIGGFILLDIQPRFLKNTLISIFIIITVCIYGLAFYKIWPKHERKEEWEKRRKEQRTRQSSYASSSSSGMIDYSDSDCSSSSDGGGGDCGGGD